MPKIPEILVASQVERSILVWPNRIIQNHLQRWSALISLTSWTKICHSIFNWQISSLPYFSSLDFNLRRRLRKWTENGKSHFFQLARFNQKMRFYFAWLITWVSDWLAQHNGKYSECLTQPVIILDVFTVKLITSHKTSHQSCWGCGLSWIHLISSGANSICVSGGSLGKPILRYKIAKFYNTVCRDKITSHRCYTFIWPLQIEWQYLTLTPTMLLCCTSPSIKYYNFFEV